MLCQSPLRTQSQIKHVGVCCKAAEWHSGNQLVIEQGSMRNQEKKCLQQQLHNRFVFSSLLQVPFLSLMGQMNYHCTTIQIE